MASEKIDAGGAALAMPTPHLAFRDEISGLRALAVGSVVVFHANPAWLPGGFVGVDIFFVISGYLISRIILDELRQGCFSIADFYAKRAKRIFPALITVMACLWIFGWFAFFPSQFATLGKHQNTSAFFYQNFRLIGEGDYFDVSATLKPLLHLWSLSIEEQFYVVWPGFLLLLLRFKRAVYPAIVTILVASLAFCLVETLRAPVSAYYLPWSRAWELALGALIAWRELFLPRPAVARNLAPDLRILIGLGAMLGAMVLLGEDQPFPGWRALVPTLGCGLILATPDAGWGRRLLAHPVAAFVGAISYPLYLWHWSLFSAARITLGERLPTTTLVLLIVASVAAATLTYRLIEQPVARIFTRHRWRVALALTLGLAAIGGLGISTARQGGFPDRYPAQVANVLNFPGRDVARQNALYGENTCLYNFRMNFGTADWHRANVARFFSANDCLAVKDKTKPTIVVVGDSHGGHLRPGLLEEFGAQANILQFDSFYCVPLIEDVAIASGRAGTERCHALNEFIFAKLREIKPAVVVLGAYFWQYENDREWIYPDYAQIMLRDAQRLHRDGIGSIVVAGELPAWDPTLPEVIGREILRGEKPAVFSRDGLRVSALETDRKLKMLPWGEGVQYVSLIDQLCNDQGCRRMAGDAMPDDIMARDYGHLTRAGSIYVVSNLLGPVIRAALKR